MQNQTQNTHKRNDDGILTLFTLTARLLWTYVKRIFNVNTIASLEKKQGPGGGSRDVEDELLDMALERNPHQYHMPPQSMKERGVETVLVINDKSRGKDEGDQG